MSKITIDILEDYLLQHYTENASEQSLFMKLVEEVGEVAEILNMRAGRKAGNKKDLDKELATEIADVLHYAIAIAAINNIDLSSVILSKDKEAAVRYNHKINLVDYIEKRI